MVEDIRQGEGVTTRQQEIEEQLRRYLIDELLDDFYDRLYDGDDPLADGEIDSLGVEQIIEYVEVSFGVTLGEEDIVVENFESLPALAALVASRC